MDRAFHEEEKMTTWRHTRLVDEGKYVAEVDVDLIETDTAWAPVLSLGRPAFVARRKSFSPPEGIK